MNKTNLAGALDGLQDENPKRFVSLVRIAWPGIKSAIDRGHSVKVIHERFVKSGIQISYRLFAMYVGQMRRESSGNGAQNLDLSPGGWVPDRPDQPPPGIGGNGLALIQAPKRRLFSAKAAARYLGVDARTLRKLTDLGNVPAKKMGVRRVYALEELDSYIESLPRLPRAS